MVTGVVPDGLASWLARGDMEVRPYIHIICILYANYIPQYLPQYSIFYHMSYIIMEPGLFNHANIIVGKCGFYVIALGIILYIIFLCGVIRCQTSCHGEAWVYVLKQTSRDSGEPCDWSPECGRARWACLVARSGSCAVDFRKDRRV